MKGPLTLIEFNEEKYVSASEVAKRLKIAQGTCKSNVLPLLTAYHLPGRKHAAYRLAEVEALSQVRIVEKQPLMLIREVAT
jgi:hypothetical protein